MIDGASRLIVMFRIAMPLAAPGLVAVFVLSLIGAWNEYLVAVTLTFRESITIPLFMQMQVSQTGYTEWWNMSAIALVSVIPMVIAEKSRSTSSCELSAGDYHVDPRSAADCSEGLISSTRFPNVRTSSAATWSNAGALPCLSGIQWA